MKQHAKVARVPDSDDDYEHHQVIDKENNSPGTKAREFCDASTQYDLRDLAETKEHSYCVRESSPIPEDMHSSQLQPPQIAPWLVTPVTDSCQSTESDEEAHSPNTDSETEKYCVFDTSCTSQDSDIEMGGQEDQKFIVFRNSLSELFRFCPTCGSSVVSQSESTSGTMLVVKMECSKGHNVNWQSQPLVAGLPAGNLITAAGILLSGGTFSKFSHFAQIIKLQFISESSFYRLQDEYLCPVVNETWKSHQESILENFKDNPLHLLGDGRCDSPGYSAKYCTYTLVEQDTGLIVDFQLVQVSEVSNSVGMEKEGFLRSVNELVTKGLTVAQIATDRHLQITSVMKKQFPDIDHQYDVWHVSKSVIKKLTQLGKAKGCSNLLPWIRSVANHLWWSSKSCNRQAENLREKWISIIYHTINVHSWENATSFGKCEHNELSLEESQRKQWLRKCSPAHDALKSVVLNKKLLKDLDKLTDFSHTGNLEVYHALLTKYCPKRQHFSYKGMLARTQLAALDHNHNTGRRQATTSSGEVRYKVVFPKPTKIWVAKPITESKSYGYLQGILKAVLNKRQLNPQPLRKHKARQPPVILPANIATCERPLKETVVSARKTRFT